MKRAGFFLAAAICVAAMGSPARATTYFSQGSVTPTTLANWDSLRAGGGAAPVNFTTAGNAFVIQNTHNMTTSAAWSVSGSGSKVQIENGGTLTAAATFAVTIGSTAAFQVDAGGTYVHQNTSAYGSTIFNGTTSLDPASTVILNNSNTTGPTGVAFGNLTVNFTIDPGGVVSCGGGLTTINGNLSIAGTSTREFRLAANSPASLTATILGDLLVSGGTFNLITGTTALTLNLGGNFSQSGGTLTSTGAGLVTLMFVGTSATFSQSGGTLTDTAINFQVASTKQLTLNNSIPLASSRSLTVRGTLNCGANAVTGAGAFALASGATLGLAAADGIDSGTAFGNIRVSGTRTFYSGANYNFSGSSAQMTGNGFPATVNNLTVSNTAGVNLNANVTVDGLLALTSGDINTLSRTLFMGNGATSTGTGDVAGSVNRGDLGGATTRSFGNPDVQITETAGTVTDITVSLFKGLAANDFSNSVKRIYTITPNNGSNITATVRLHYLHGELNGNSESTLNLWRRDGVTGWSDQTGLTTRHNDNPGDQNWVERSGVVQFSEWTIAGPVTPTDVALVSFKATRYGDRVLLEWQTGYEVNNVGFNVYREKNGNLEAVTPEPVAGSALIAGPGTTLRAGFAYSWWDEGNADCGLPIADCQDTRYWIEDIDLSGLTTVHGPFGVDQPAPGDRRAPPGKGRVSLLSALGRDVAVEVPTGQVERFAKVAKLTAARAAVQAGLASQRAVKVSVQREGWYRIEQAELLAAGIPAGVDPRKLQLFADGREVAMVVTAGKTKSSWDGIEFYGVPIDSPSTANHTYWLVAGSQLGARVRSSEGQEGSPGPQAFSYAVERRDKAVYFPALKNGGREKFFGPLIFNARPADQSLVLQHVAASGGNATLEVSVQGFTDAPHSVRVLLNGEQLGSISFSGLSKGVGQYSIAQSALKEGANQVQLIGPAGFGDISMSEYVRLTYLHTNEADNNALRFQATGNTTVTIRGFTSSAVRVIDVTAPRAPQELKATVTKGGDGFSITVTAPAKGARTLLALASDQRKKPAAIVADQPSSWRDPSRGSDYIVITGKELISSLAPLVAHRKSQGLTPVVVDIEDVYDEFSFGNKSTQAVKDFLAYAKGSWAKAPRFVVLAGDATFDPKNYTGLGDFDIVPTKLVETAFNETASDDWFVDVNGDGAPAMAIGRLPVRSPQETAALVSKIVRYDQSAATNSVLLVADRNQGFDFEGADTQLRSMIPGNLAVTDIRRGQAGDANARSQLLAGINRGQKLVNYYGHGSTQLWTDAPILMASDAASLVNRDGLALFVAMTCLNGFFHDPAIESLAESLLKAEGGAIAVWASSGLTDPNAQAAMNLQAMRLLLRSSGLTIGEVTVRAKAAVANVDVRRTWILLGDPATKLK
jgi:Peptidase family C25